MQLYYRAAGLRRFKYEYLFSSGQIIGPKELPIRSTRRPRPTPLQWNVLPPDSP